MLPALSERLGQHFHIQDLTAVSGQMPAAVVGSAIGAEPRLEGLLQPHFVQDVLNICCIDLNEHDLREWSVFLQRYRSARASGRTGPALLIEAKPHGLVVSDDELQSSWRSALRRGDLVIWAEEHLPDARHGLLAELAVATAVALCGARLDLAALLVRARCDDLADPLGWLGKRTEPASVDDTACPLALLRDGKLRVLQQQVWHAQLVSLFPVLENERIQIIERYRRYLVIDEHLRSLGVQAVEEIELGALKHQLENVAPRHEADRMAMLTRIRNALAHRQAADAADIEKLVASVGSTGRSARGTHRS
jgi:hypothetical protein